MEEIIIAKDNENPPYCKGCWNENGSCGTPCMDCPKVKEWDCYILRIFIKKKVK